VSLSKNIYLPGEKIVVNYSGFPGNARDWISIAEPGSTDDKYLIWGYIEGKRSGTIEFAGRASGNYEIRGYYDNQSIVRVRVSFKVGNSDNNLMVKSDKTLYKAWEKITVQFSGLPGNNSDWISLSAVGTADDQYKRWAYTEGKQSGSMDFPGLEEGKYEVRVFFNNERTARVKYPFTIGKTTGSKICRTELSTFYAGMNSLGLCWGRLGSDAFVPAMIAEVQNTLTNVITAVRVIPCLDFDISKISNYSLRLPTLNRVQAVDEIDRLIKDIQAAVVKADIKCDNGANLHSLFIGGVHLGAAQAIANTFVCRMIDAAWQSNLTNHLVTARNGLSGFNNCIPSVNLSVFNTVNVSATNAYSPFATIVGIHQQVLWAVALTDCCCYCN